MTAKEPIRAREREALLVKAPPNQPPDTIYAETVEEQIYRLKLEGYAPREIAQFTGQPPESVEEIIIQMAEHSRQRLLAEMTVGTIIEVDRLDAMHKALWPLASTGVAGAIDRVLEISKERRKLLGLDAANGIAPYEEGADLSVLATAEVLEYERIQRKLLAATPPKPPAARRPRGRPRRTEPTTGAGAGAGAVLDAEIVPTEGGGSA